MDVAQRFMDLFIGSDKTYGQWNPANVEPDIKMFTIKKKVTINEFRRHLNGEFGLGCVPVNSEGMCNWAAIDIDSHDGEVVDINTISRSIFSKGIPLVPCRSKSGGVHCYMFTSEPIPAVLVKKVLIKWAEDIGFGGSEIFPKQVSTRDNNTGNWLNLAYYDARNTVRYSVEIEGKNAKKLDVEQFIERAETCKLSKSMLRSFILSGHEQAPPCIQELMIEGVSKGTRNEALYAFTIYLKKRFPASSYRQEILAINQEVFDRPLPLSEANRSIQSASRAEYRYKCMEEPCRSRCDSKTCLSREFGIEPSDSFDTGEGMPDFTRLRVINTEPPMWELTVDKTPIVIQTKVLRSFQLLAEEIMDKLFVVVPLIKQKDWLPLLSDMMQNLEHISAPDNASISGIIRERMLEFVDRADFNSNGKDPKDKNLINRGLPVLQEVHGTPGYREILFRGGDFVMFLKRTRSEELKGNALWMALRKMGIQYKRTRISGRVKSVWALPVDGAGLTKLDPEYDYSKGFIHSNKKKAVNIMSKLNF